MGRPYYSGNANATSIQSFRDRTYVLNGAVLSATGVSNHEAFVRAVEEAFSESAVGSASEVSVPAFIGGEARVHAPSAGYAHVALAFKGPMSTPVLNVIKHCISLSNERVSGFSAMGLVGVYGGASSADSGTVTDELCSSITTVPSAALVERAKGLAKAEALFALDGGSQSLANSMSASVLESGSFSAQSIAAAYDSISPTQISAAFTAIAKSAPAMAAVGDLASVPYRGSLVSRFA